MAVLCNCRGTSKPGRLKVPGKKISQKLCRIVMGPFEVRTCDTQCPMVLTENEGLEERRILDILVPGTSKRQNRNPGVRRRHTKNFRSYLRKRAEARVYDKLSGMYERRRYIPDGL